MFLRRGLLFLVWCVLLCTAGCATVGNQGEFAAHEPSYGQLSLFLNGPDRATLEVSFVLTSVSIVAEDGTTREIMSKPMTVNSRTLAGRQIVLSDRTLPEGTYKKIKFAVKEATIKKKDRVATLALPPEGIEFDARFTISRGRNTSLFLNWNADASVVDGYMFKPVVFLKGQSPELSSLLIYVTNEDSNNVSVISRQTGEVVATIMVGSKPKGIAIGQKLENLKVYVANSGSNSISVIDPTKNKVDVEIPIRYGWGAEGLAVVKVSKDRELIFVSNYNSNTVSVVDGATYQEVEKINVGNGPIAVAADPPVETLMNSRTLSQDSINTLRTYRDRFINVYVANRNSKDISVIRIDVATGRSVEVFNLNTDWSPISFGVDYQRGKLYVANFDSDKLSVLDLVKLVKGSRADAVGTINNIGPSCIGIAADPGFERLYLLKELTGEVMVIRPHIEGADPLKMALVPIMDIISVGNSPRSLTMDPEARKLYVVNRGADSVSVIDKTTGKVEQAIPVGKRPYGIAVSPR